MRKAKRKALKALAKASDVYTCWAILDEAVTCGELDGFTRQYIEGERKVLADEILDEIHALRKLGKRYGIKLTACIEMKPWRADE